MSHWRAAGVDAGRSFLLASPITEENILNPKNASGFSVFADEIEFLMNIGYRWPGSGNYVVPPG